VGRDRTILDTAADAFYEKGFHGVGVDELGRRAGLSGPALYRSFAGKDEILATLLNEAMDELMGAALPLLGDPALDLDRALRHHILFSIHHRPLVNLYQREVRSLVEPWKRSFTRRRQQYTERWEALLAGRFPDLDATEIATTTQATLGTIFSISYWPQRTAQAPDVVEQLMKLLTRGFRALEPASGP
jgi:AcrR family transcriptional regulator